MIFKLNDRWEYEIRTFRKDYVEMLKKKMWEREAKIEGEGEQGSTQTIEAKTLTDGTK